MVNIAIVGHGKMGRMIEQLATEKGHVIKAVIDDFKDLTQEKLVDVDVCIDFTEPESVLSNLKLYANLGKNAVVGTTGWYDQMDEARLIVERAGIGVIWSSNFSIGVYAMIEIAKHSARIMDRLESYDVAIVEHHHKSKKDSPSGTALSISEAILGNLNRKNKVIAGNTSGLIKESELQISSIRMGSMPGEHKIIYDSEEDTIEVLHRARNRKGFALGSLVAANFIVDKKGFFGMDDMMKEIFGGTKDV